MKDNKTKVTKVTKLKTLEKKQKQMKQLKAQIQALEAGEKTRERKRDTRRKILIGAYFLDDAKAKDKVDELYQRLDKYLKRNSDRVLFNLDPLTVDQAPK